MWHVCCYWCIDSSPISWEITWKENQCYFFPMKIVFVKDHRRREDQICSSLETHLSNPTGTRKQCQNHSRANICKCKSKVHISVSCALLLSLSFSPSGWWYCFPKYRWHFWAPGGYPCHTCTSCIQPPKNCFVILQDEVCVALYVLQSMTESAEIELREQLEYLKER